MRVWSAIVNALNSHASCALVTQLEVQGSAPREPGARMVVMPDGTFTGTIGGGALEWHILARTQKMLRGGTPGCEITQHALGPEMGQCCGGAVAVMIEVWQAGRLAEARELARAESTGPFATRARLAGGEAVARTIFEGEECGTGGVDWERSGDLTERFGQRDRALLLFGAGHVGRALMLALAPLPFAVTWIDERREAFPAAVPGNVTMVATGEPAGHLAAAPDGAMVVAMTHSHARDFEIVEAALAENRFAYVGVIGSKTKRARFSSRLRKAGLAEHIVSRLICPIGVAGVASKTPASIAAGVAAQLLQFDELVKTGQKPVQMAAQEVTMVHRQRLSHGRGD
jgi:xanthine dehydrogenase accessory factor